MTSSARDPATITRDHERLLTRRLPWFALAWLGEAVLWTGVLVVQSYASLPGASLILAGQVAIIGGMVAAGWSERGAGRLLHLLVAGSIVLGLSVIATFAVVRGDPDFLGFILLTLFLASSLWFAWGWRPALVVVGVTLAVWAWLLPRTPMHGPAPELFGAALIGTVLSLLVAEGHWRSFVAGAEHERERDAVLGRERAALADAQRATEAKDRFLAIVSHELRSPLAAALHWAFILRRRKDDPEGVTRAIDGVDGSVRLAVRLIEDLLDVARAAQGKLALRMAPVDLGPVVSEVVEGARFAAQEAGVTLALAMSGERISVYGDAGRLRQVVDNLVSNALKFTPPGGRVDVALRLEPPDVALVVQDSGAGIAADVLPHVFEPFRQGSAEGGHHNGGLGLGLAIVHHLVEAHGGRVDAVSDGAGRGATFRVHLPAAESASPTLPELDRRRVLLVDEEARAREFIRDLFERCGAEVVSVATASEALQALGTYRPDVLVADVVVRRAGRETSLAALRRAGAGVPAVVFGAAMTPEERRELTDAGFDVCLASSDPAAVVAAVADVLPHGRSRV